MAKSKKISTELDLTAWGYQEGQDVEEFLSAWGYVKGEDEINEFVLKLWNVKLK